MRHLLGLGLATLAGLGCAGEPPAEARLLARVPADMQVVVAIAPARVRGTWLDRGAAVYAAAVPACARERARGADAVVLGWRPDAWMMLLAGGTATAPGCDALARTGSVAWLAGGRPPRAEDDAGFFATPDRRRRWLGLGPDAPVRAIGEVEVSSGIVARGIATLDPRGGVDAHAVVRFDDRAAAGGAVETLVRWRAGLDHDRLGGAWPLFAALEARVDDRAVVATLRLGGAGGSDAATLGIAAAIAGFTGTAAPPCPAIHDDWAGRVSCTGPGRFEIDPALRVELLDDPAALARSARLVPAFKRGRRQGLKLFAIRPASFAAAIGLANSDVVRVVAGFDLADDARTNGHAALVTALRTLDTIEIVLERRGEPVTLTYQFR